MCFLSEKLVIGSLNVFWCLADDVINEVDKEQKWTNKDKQPSESVAIYIRSEMLMMMMMMSVNVMFIGKLKAFIQLFNGNWFENAIELP